MIRYRTAMQRFLTYLIIFLLLLTTGGTASASQRNKKDKKKAAEIIIHVPEPDAYPQMRLDTPLNESPPARDASHRHINTLGEGIDVSHYQGTIDWEAVAATGKVGYAYVKASESVSFVDDYYYYNIDEGRKYGITMGSYHFYRAHVDQEAQFQHMISVIDPAKQDIVPLIDVEAANGVGVEAFATRLKAFLRRVEQYYGRPPVLYTYLNFYNKYLAYRGFDHYPVMIASYNDEIPVTNDGLKYVMWQYTSKGRINGVRGNVDRSRFMNGHNVYDIIY